MTEVDATVPEILLLNGPNLGSLGTREPAIYGTTSLQDVENNVAARLAADGFGLRAEQHDCEGCLLRALRGNADTAGAIVNPGALMVAGWSLRDALAGYPAPWVEVHISNVWARESFRHTSILSGLAVGVVAGFGVYGYELAAAALIQRLASGGPELT